MKTLIYLITNIENDPNKIYIGKTINLIRRNQEHYKTYGKQININVIDEINSLSRKEWMFLENFWMEQFRQWGFQLVNINKKGGGGPEFRSESTKLKISIANSKPKPEGFGKILSLIQKGKKKPKTSLANKNKKKPPRTTEHIKNLSKPRKSTINMCKPKSKVVRVTCPFCGKFGLAGPMSRYHFSKCKLNKL